MGTIDTSWSIAIYSEPFKFPNSLVVTDIDEKIFAFDDMYPNPTKGFVTIEAPTGAQLHITNLAGQMVKDINIYANVRNDITSLAAGYYL